MLIPLFNFEIKISVFLNTNICISNIDICIKWVKSKKGHRKINEPPHDKTNNVAVRLAKTQIRLDSLTESSLSA